MYKSSYCSIFSPVFGVIGIPDLGHSNRCVGHDWSDLAAAVIVSCFNFYFPDDIRHGESFHMFVTCISSLKRCLLKILAHYLICLFPYCWVLSVLSIFWLTILYQIWLANIFSHTMAHFLTLLIWFYCFLQDRSFNFNDIQFINYLFHGSSLLVLPCLFYSLYLIILLTYFKIWFSHLCFCCFFLITNFPSPCLTYSF